SAYPELVEVIKTRLRDLRSSGAPLSVITARGVMIATIMEQKPEILDKTFPDGSKFQASDSFVRSWLHDALNWS
ncbi:hypothetical protein K435DRAFT_695678, partial [Dendrothele bispora CBS 962.96]